jgi:hypothetical protein
MTKADRSCFRLDHANADRVIAWINEPKRKPAMLAFTEGPERQIAYAIEGLIRRERSKIIAVRKTK